MLNTSGGTMFAFTPGGTKIVYTRDYLMSLKNSPASLVSSLKFLKKCRIWNFSDVHLTIKR